MEPGHVVEYIDRQKILCAVILEHKKQKLRLLNESNRELSLSPGRILHVGDSRLDTSAPRDRLLDQLKETGQYRRGLAEQIDIEELWEILHEEQEWLDADFVAGLCFPKNSDGDHAAAVIRAFFQNRVYFKFDQNRFFPYSEDQVEKILAQRAEEERKKRLIEEGGSWLNRAVREEGAAGDDAREEYIDILKSLYLHEKESPHYLVGREMLKKSGVADAKDLFNVLVGLNVFDADENIELLRLETPVEFPSAVIESIPSSLPPFAGSGRADFTGKDAITVDGVGTKDFDDAVSIEREGENMRVGIHIIDVGHFVPKGSPVDEEALFRGSSIYMPDQKIPMLPSALSEDACSLTANAPKPAISVMVTVSPGGKIREYRVVPSIIRVVHQLTYTDVDGMIGQSGDVRMLLDIAGKFRQQRLSQGAVHISLPEIQLWVDESRRLHVERIDRESPGRMMIAELMILANWMMAKFLSENGIPAIFRSQPQPRERLYNGEEGTLFQNYMQRRLLSRFQLSQRPEAHSGLGLNAYVTATSPIRKYYDLVTQRQIRAVLGFDTPYASEDIQRIVQRLELPLQHVARLQLYRNRYWTLKHLEEKIGETYEAIVLVKRKNSYQILIPEFMVECDIPASNGIHLKPEDGIHVKIQHADAKKNLFSVFLTPA